MLQTKFLTALSSLIGTTWKCWEFIACYTWITTIVPTAVAACAARGEGGSPTGMSLSIWKTNSHYKSLKFRCKFIFGNSLDHFLQECHQHHNLIITFLLSYQPHPRTMQINTPYSSSLDSSKSAFAAHMGAIPCVSHTHSCPYSGHLVGGTQSKSSLQAQCGQPNSSNTLHNQVNCHMGFAPL